MATVTLSVVVWTAVANSADPGCSLDGIRPYVATLTVEPGGDAFRSGLRTGDIVDIRGLQPAVRYRFATGLFVRHDRLTIPVLRHGRSLTFTFIAMTRTPITWDSWVAYAGNLWVILFATLIAWRRPQDREARVVALLLSTMIIGVTLDVDNWATRWSALDAGVSAVGGALLPTAYALFVTYVMLFANPPSRLRLNLARLAYASSALAALSWSLYIYVLWSGVIDPLGPFESDQLAVCASAAMLAGLVCGIASLASTRGLERTRLSWAMLSLGSYYAFDLAFTILPLIWPSLDNSPFVDVMNFALPLGLTYSVLSRRLLDIGFALNRATVFTIVSVIIVGLFMLAEWLMGTWLASQSHVTSLAVNAGLVVALGFSSRAIHHRVDHVVDVLFFRKRHEDEQAILEFAREAAFATDSAQLLSGAIAVLESRADAAFVTIALDDAHGCYAGVSKGDPAILALQARHRPVDLRETRSGFSGEYAYPMAVGGRLVGVLVLGPKRSGELYAPDESNAIAKLAVDVGAALAVHALDADNMSLPQAIAQRLERLGAQSS
ncbi:MAG TPA: hypothetical protein VGX91_09870 [Candidatus Cybelea sp.]|nr:hypothetical protein [Candidatus Cybelea sp.]